MLTHHLPAFACRNTSYFLLLLAGLGIQEERSVAPNLREVEHLVDRVGDRIKRSGADALSSQPVVFDEVNHRGLIGHGVVHKILPSPG